MDTICSSLMGLSTLMCRCRSNKARLLWRNKLVRLSTDIFFRARLMPAGKDSSLPIEYELPSSMHWAYLEILDSSGKHSSLYWQTGAYP